MVLANLHTPMVAITRAIGLMEEKMDMERLSILMEVYTQVTTNMISRMGMVPSTLLLDLCTKENG